MDGGSYQEFYAVIRQIPSGRVATYGSVAELAGRPRQARQVGYALAALANESDVPWHRVVNAAGGISSRATGCEELQRILLEEEGVEFSPGGNLSLERFGWGA